MKSEDSTVERCGYPRCINAAPPPEKWAQCFYNGSPCQSARPESDTTTGGSSDA